MSKKKKKKLTVWEKEGQLLEYVLEQMRGDGIQSTVEV